MLASRSCSIVLQLTLSSSGDATTTVIACARLTATLKRFLLYKNSKLRGTSSALELVYDTNTIGASELGTVWTDPDFDPTQKAFYYARVIEIPTPRWTAYDAFRFGIKMPPEVPMTTRERAYTSPIWYTQAK